MELAKRVIEDRAALDFHSKLQVRIPSVCLLQLKSPDEALGVKLEYLGNPHNKVLELGIDHLVVDHDEAIDQLLVGDKETYQGLEASKVL